MTDVIYKKKYYKVVNFNEIFYFYSNDRDRFLGKLKIQQTR